MALLLWLAVSTPAAALCFGTSDGFEHIGNINVSDRATLRGKIPDQWLDGRYALGIHMRDHCFLLPYWSDNAGYAIYDLDYRTHAARHGKYWALDAASIFELQRIGVLSNPLPANDVPFYVGNHGKLLTIVAVAATWVAGLYLAFMRQSRIASAVRGKLDGDFLRLLYEVMTDIATVVGDGTQRSEAIIAEFLARHGHAMVPARPDHLALGRSCTRKELLIYLGAVAEGLNSEQKKLLLLGIATVLLKNDRVGFFEKRLFKKYIRVLGVRASMDEMMKTSLEAASS